MELASKGPISFSPKLEWFLAALFLFLGVLGLGNFVFGLKEMKLDPLFIRKTRFYAVCVFWRLRRWESAGQALGLCCLAPPGAGKALGRRWADLFWENGHCDFIHRWIELKFGYVGLNP